MDEKKIFFVALSKDTNGYGSGSCYFRQSEARIRGSGSVPKCHGSATLVRNGTVRALKIWRQ
jgi:hypothetical protein